MNKIFLIILLPCVLMFGNIAKGESSSSNFIFVNNLTIGNTGNEVSSLQQFLIDNGFLKISNPTGYFGTLTKNALSKWQASVNISPSVGFFGPISREKINSIIQQPLIKIPSDVISVNNLSSTTTTTEIATSTTDINIKNGSPVRLKIPSLNIDASFQYNGLTSDGAMEIPNNITDVGWFTGSPRPGEKGSSVITGHVAQIRGGVVTKPGVFSNLNELRVGDKLYVINDKGESMTFAVREIRNYDSTADATDVFTSKDGGAHLNLITCEGVWNSSKLSYSQRLVVFTDIVQ